MAYPLTHITARWWSRILLFLLLWVLFSIAEYSNYPEYLPWLSCIAAALLTEYLRRGNSIVGLGLSFKKQTFFREVFWGIFSAIIAIGGVILTAIILGARFKSVEDPLFFLPLVLLLLKIFILAAGEEFLFRGIIFQAVVERFKMPMAVALSTAIFIYGHLANPGATVFSSVNIALANLVFCTMYLSTGSLWPSIAFHFSWNFAQALMGLRVSGLNFGDPLLKMDLLKIPQNLHWIIFSPEFGIEAGFTTTLVLILAIIILPRFLKTSAFASAGVFKRRFAESEFTAG
ncbi:MAG: CPBP family intramembrane glutamic endopeptidase [Bacteroidota bacterium]